MRRVSVIFNSENHGNDSAVRRCLSDKTKWFYQIIVSDKNILPRIGGGHKKVILLFAGTAWLWSCRFLFQQFFHGDKAHKVVGDADALSALSAALVGGFDVDMPSHSFVIFSPLR